MEKTYSLEYATIWKQQSSHAEVVLENGSLVSPYGFLDAKDVSVNLKLLDVIQDLTLPLGLGENEKMR